MNTMGEDAERTCPLCMEEMDLTDQQLKPCKCGYEICVWCWHHIMDMAEKDDTEGRCPACRTPYDKERIVGMTVSSERLAEINNEKKQKSQKAKSKTSEGRKHLSTVRVIQRNLVYIVGIPANLADEETLQRKEFFGQYGKILKVSITRTGGAAQHSSNNSCSVYITYSKNEEAIRCIQVVNGFILDGRSLRACFGTTKYCHAWLRNMPCGNPDCLYLHDAGTQEDTFTKDEAISTCASKIQHSISSALNNLHQRSGSFLPPPIDNFCGNSAISPSKTLVKPVLHGTGVHSKSSLLNGETGKSGGLPAAAAWGVRVNCSASCAEVTQGTSRHKSNFGSSLTASAGREAQLPTQTCEQETHVEHIGASRNQRLMGSSRSDSFPMQKPNKDYNVENRHVEAIIETKVVVKGLPCEPSCPSSNGGTRGGVIPVSHSFDSSGLGQKVSNSLPNSEVIESPIVEETIQSSVQRLHLATDETSNSFQTFNSGRNNMISSQSHIDTSPSEQVSVSSQENLKPSMEGLVVGAPLTDTLTSQTVPSPAEESTLISKIGVNMSPNKNQDGRSIYQTSTARLGDSGLSTHDFVAEPTVEVSSMPGLILSRSPNSNPENLTNEAYSHGGDIQSTYMANGTHNFTLLEKGGSQNSTVYEELEADDGENSIITDILSLDIGLDDPLASPSLAKLLRGNNDKTTDYLRLLSPWKSTSNNESRFSFARMDDSNQENSHPLDSQINRGVQINRFPNGIALAVSEEPDVFSSQQQLYSSRAMAPLSLLSRPEEIPPPKSPIQRKVPPVPPPGFYPQHAMDRDQYSSLLRSPGSAAQYQFVGSSAGLNLPQQTVGNSSYADVEFIDPAIMAVSGGKLPLPMTHQISPSYSSNMLAGFPEMDQRLQLLKSRSNNLNQSSVITSDQSKWSLLQDLALQEARRTPNGSWSGAWGIGNQPSIESGLLGRRGQSSLSEITNGGRMGYLDSQYGFLRPYAAHEDTKFQASNSGRFYNSAYDM